MPWKDVKKPKVGGNIYGITKYNGGSVSTDSLGVIISANLKIIVVGIEELDVLARQRLVFKKNI